MSRTAFVTGGTGCVGRNLIDALLAEGWRIVATCRPSPRLRRLELPGVEIRQVDLADAAGVLAAMPPQVDAVFHAAANVSHWFRDAPAQHRDNVVATRNLVEAALARGARRFVFTSTGATNRHPGSDAAAAARIHCQYVRTKRLAELEVEAGLRRGLHTVTLKPGIVIGAYDWNNYAQIFTMLQRSPRLIVVLPGTIGFCHAADVARAHVRAAERAPCGAIYQLGGEATSWLDVYQRIARLLGVRAPRRTTPSWQLWMFAYALGGAALVTGRRPPLTPQLLRLLAPGGRTPAEDLAAAKRDLGYESRSIDAMLTDCLRWMRSEGLLPPPVDRQTIAVLTPSEQVHLIGTSRRQDVTDHQDHVGSSGRSAAEWPP